MAVNGRLRPAQQQAQATPRLFVNANGDGSRFYYYYLPDSTTAIRFLDIATQRYGNFMPPIRDKQTYICTDGTSFAFFPDGTGYYTNYMGPVLIPAGKYAWMPPPMMMMQACSSSVVGAPSQAPPTDQTKARPQAAPSTEDSSDDDMIDDDGYDRRWRLGLA